MHGPALSSYELPLVVPGLRVRLLTQPVARRLADQTMAPRVRCRAAVKAGTTPVVRRCSFSVRAWANITLLKSCVILYINRWSWYMYICTRVPPVPQGCLGFSVPRGDTCKGSGQVPATTSKEGCRRRGPTEALPRGG